MSTKKWLALALLIGLSGVVLHLVKPLVPIDLLTLRVLGLYAYEIILFWVAGAIGAAGLWRLQQSHGAEEQEDR